jgi:hypothetical protein
VVVGGTDGTGAALASLERFVPQGPGTDTYRGAFSTLAAVLPGPRAGVAATLGLGAELFVSGGRGPEGAVADLQVLAQCLPDDGLACPAP